MSAESDELVSAIRALPYRDRCFKFLDMTVRLGMSYSEIARKFGYSVSVVQRAIYKALDESWADDETGERRKAERRIDINRCNRAIRTLLGEVDKGGQDAVKAANSLRGMLERRARLMGLDAPEKIAITDTDGNDSMPGFNFVVATPADVAKAKAASSPFETPPDTKPVE